MVSDRVITVMKSALSGKQKEVLYWLCITPSLTHSYINSVFTCLCRFQCVQTMKVTLGPLVRCGMGLHAAAVCTSVWRMALWWPSNQTATLSQHHSVRGRENTYWMCWKKEPAAQRKFAVSFKIQRSSKKTFQISQDEFTLC